MRAEVLQHQTILQEIVDRHLLKEDTRPFNPQVLLATSGAANAGIDNPGVYGVFCFEFPPSTEDCIQKEGRAGRRVPMPGDTRDWYCICI